MITEARRFGFFRKLEEEAEVEGECARRIQQSVRQRDCLIEEVIDPPNGGDATLVTLSCIDQDAQGKRIQILWELEPEAYVKDIVRSTLY